VLFGVYAVYDGMKSHIFFFFFFSRIAGIFIFRVWIARGFELTFSFLSSIPFLECIDRWFHTLNLHLARRLILAHGRVPIWRPLITMAGSTNGPAIHSLKMKRRETGFRFSVLMAT